MNMFSTLSKLTSLGLGIGVARQEATSLWLPLQDLKVPPELLVDLKKATAPWHRLHGDGLLANSSLESVSVGVVGGLQLTDTWRDRTAEGSRIWRLEITGSIDDEDWFRLPTLPELRPAAGSKLQGQHHRPAPGPGRCAQQACQHLGARHAGRSRRVCL
jgi:hypothetical protein